MQHPKLEQPLIKKLEELANQRGFPDGLRSAATKVLNNFEPARSPSTISWRVSTVQVVRRVASLMLNVSHSGLNSQEEQGDPNLQSSYSETTHAP